MSGSALHDLRYLNGLKAVRDWLGLSLSEMGKALGTSDAMVANWQSGHRIMPASAIEKVGVMIANRLTEEMGRTVGVKMEINSPWHITAWVQCSRCRAWFQLRRRRDRWCPECRKELGR